MGTIGVLIEYLKSAYSTLIYFCLLINHQPLWRFWLSVCRGLCHSLGKYLRQSLGDKINLCTRLIATKTLKKSF